MSSRSRDHPVQSVRCALDVAEQHPAIMFRELNVRVEQPARRRLDRANGVRKS